MTTIVLPRISRPMYLERPELLQGMEVLWSCGCPALPAGSLLERFICRNAHSYEVETP